MENELGIMPTANWGGSDNHTKLAAITAERDRLRNKNKKLNGLLNYLKMHIDYVMDGDKNSGSMLCLSLLNAKPPP